MIREHNEYAREAGLHGAKVKMKQKRKSRKNVNITLSDKQKDQADAILKNRLKQKAF